MTNKIMVNGITTSSIDVMDRGCQYGDGLFETMQVVNHNIPLWQQHWQRLQKGCAVLSITIPDKAALEENIAAITKNVTHGVVKLLVTRGAGGRGYASTEKLEPDVILIQVDYPDYPARYWQDGIEARTCQTRLSHQPALAGIKHMNRLEQVLARNEWQDRETCEGIMLDYHNNVIEGTMTNIFLAREGIIQTPVLEMCGVAGLMRETVLTILEKEKIPFEITNISKETLMSADEVFLTNSVIGLWPVK
ncbi:MAG: aminodeoxychorismate lyase, partial [Gammaproteobacteria bacterium]